VPDSLLAFLRTHVDSIGSIAGILTTVSFAPQLVLAWRTKGEGLSWAMLVLFGSGVGLWLGYGILLPSMPVMLANGFTELQIVLIALIKLFGRVHVGQAERSIE
jgi:MtN3 and saliva related transmembrane protein